MSKDDRVVIFDTGIDRITREKLTSIILRNTTISESSFPKLRYALRTNPQLKRIEVICIEENKETLDKFFGIFRDENGNIAIDLNKIVLRGELKSLDNDFFTLVRNIEIEDYDIKEWDKIQEKFPSLKNVIYTGIISENDLGKDLTKLFSLSKYMDVVKLDFPRTDTSVRDFIKENNLFGYILSADGKSLINLARIRNRRIDVPELKINLSDLTKIKPYQLKNTEVTVVIDDASQLSREKLEEYKHQGYKIKKIEIFSKENNKSQNQPYDLRTYIQIRERLEELVEGIPLHISQKERFAEVYKRICQSIVYDTPAVYPETATEKQYSVNESSNCRNLKNGLLKGKCVCAGYADILRNALAMVGIEAKYISGDVIDEVISAKDFDKRKFKKDVNFEKIGDKVFILGSHAWNKVKLDDKWYNVDVTWDAVKVRSGMNPTYCLRTDEEIQKKEKKIKFKGPECVTKVDREEIAEMFNISHFRIGKVEIPNMRDVKGVLRYTREDLADFGSSIKRKFLKFKERMQNIFKREKNLLLDESDEEYDEYYDDQYDSDDDQIDDTAEQEDGTSRSSTQENSWDLSNWKIDRTEFSKETDKIARRTNDGKRESDREDEIK